MVVAAALALMATSAPNDTLREAVTTDISLAEPARFQVEVLLNEAAITGDFDVGPQLRIDTTGYYPAGTLAETAGRPLPEVSVTVTPLREDGTRLDPTSESWVDHPTDCPDDEVCVLRYEVRVAMANDAHPSARARVSLEGYVQYEWARFLGGPTIPEGSGLGIEITDAEGREVDDGATSGAAAPDALEELEVTVGHDLPAARMVFVRAVDASSDPISVRGHGRLAPVVDDLPSTDDTLVVSREEPLAFRPFDGCAAGAPCLREYHVPRSGSTSTTLYLTLPEGVRVEPGSLSVPPLDGTREVPADDVISLTAEGRVELPRRGTARRDQIVRLSPQEAPTNAGPWLSAFLEVTVDAPSGTTVVAGLAEAHRQLGEDLSSSSIGTWVSGQLVPASPSGDGSTDAGSTHTARRAYEAPLPVSFEAAGPATVTWRLTVRMDAASMLLPEGATPRLVPVEEPSAATDRENTG